MQLMIMKLAVRAEGTFRRGKCVGSQDCKCRVQFGNDVSFTCCKGKKNLLIETKAHNFSNFDFTTTTIISSLINYAYSFSVTDREM